MFPKLGYLGYCSSLIDEQLSDLIYQTEIQELLHNLKHLLLIRNQIHANIIIQSKSGFLAPLNAHKRGKETRMAKNPILVEKSKT